MTANSNHGGTANLNHDHASVNLAHLQQLNVLINQALKALGHDPSTVHAVAPLHGPAPPNAGAAINAHATTVGSLLGASNLPAGAVNKPPSTAPSNGVVTAANVGIHGTASYSAHKTTAAIASTNGVVTTAHGVSNSAVINAANLEPKSWKTTLQNNTGKPSLALSYYPPTVTAGGY